MLMLLTDKYADKIYGTITCYDRMIIQGYTPGWSHAEGMAGYLKANKIRIFDFANFSQSLTEQVRSNAQHIADENGIEIEFIRKLHAFRKDDRMQDNAFLEISDIEAAQKLSDRISPEDLHKILDVLAKRYCPVAQTPGPGYT